MAKKRWAVDCTWMVRGTDYVDADTAEEAAAIVSAPNRPLPEDRSYIEGSFKVESVTEEGNDENY